MRGRKFLFDNSFDEAAQNRLKAEADARARREAEALANTPPTFTVEELEAAKAAGGDQLKVFPSQKKAVQTPENKRSHGKK